MCRLWLFTLSQFTRQILQIASTIIFGMYLSRLLPFGNDSDEKPSDTASTKSARRVSNTVKWALTMQNTHPIPVNSGVY